MTNASILRWNTESSAMGPIRFSCRWAALILAGLTLLNGCARNEPETVTKAGKTFTRIILQSDWFAQPEHGGFYQALANGYYEEAGLEVEIRQGGPNAMPAAKLIAGQVHFAFGRSYEGILRVARGVPLLMVGAFLQHDPQGIMSHEENPVNSFEDLDGKNIMAMPGMAWIDMLKMKYNIEFGVIPHDFGMERFINDKTFIMQCFVTNEPYYVRRKGAHPKTLLISSSGFDPCHVIYTTQQFARDNPEIVRAFVAASIRGWRDYITGDPSPANKLIAARNPRMTADFMAFVRHALIENKLVAGYPERGEYIGLFSPARMEEQMQDLLSVDLLDKPLPVKSFMTTRFLPELP